jgi:phosphate-selective porin OprO/OprP
MRLIAASALVAVFGLAGMTPLRLFAQDAHSAADREAMLQRLSQAEAEIRALQDALNSGSPVHVAAPLPVPDAETKTYPTIKPHGSIQADAGWFSQSPANRATVGDVPDGADFRRARVGVSGSVWDNVNYWFQMDFAFPGRPTFTDVWLDIVDVPYLGNVRVGQWKQYFGLEELTSFRFNPFLERASIFLFKPFRRLGAGFYDHSADESTTWAVSGFRAGNDQFGGDLGDAGGWALAARLTHAPLYEDEGRRVVHLGASYHLADPANDLMRFGTFGGNAPEFGLISGTTITPSFVDTGPIPSNIYNAFLVEGAWVNGPLSVQAEVVATYLSQIAGPPLRFWGGYVYATYFLTGEHRSYNRPLAVFDRVSPLQNFNPFQSGTWCGGAWEVAARLSYIDLSDRTIQGGELTDITLGLNWYLNPYTKLTFNYIHAFLDRPPAGASNADVYAVRAQVDF